MKNNHVDFCNKLYDNIIDFENNCRTEYANVLKKYLNELLNKIEILVQAKKLMKKSNFNDEYNKKSEQLIKFEITEKDFEDFLKSSLIKISIDND